MSSEHQPYFSCYIAAIEMDNLSAVASAIQFNTYSGNAGLPLPCPKACVAGRRMAEILMQRRETQQAISGLPEFCTASYDAPPVLTQSLSADASGAILT